MARVYGRLHRAVAAHKDVQAALQNVAEDVAERARGIARAHHVSGEYESAVTVGRGRIDRYVYLDLEKDPAAIDKEFGRTGAKGRGTSQGIYALTRAAAGEGG